MLTAWRTYLAEALGTFLLVFAGPGAAVIDAISGGGVSPTGVGFSFGLAVAGAILVFGPISGAHINPAVTLALAVAGRFPWARVMPYVVAQLLGAVAASALHRVLFGNVANLGATVPGGGAGQGLLLEMAITAFLFLVIISVAIERRASLGMAAASIGAYVGLAATFSGPIAGASMNPARSFGPAVVSGTWTDHWIYWAGPIAGALIGLALWRLVRPADPSLVVEPERGATAG